MNKKISLTVSLISLAALTMQISAQACSFDSQPYFTYTMHPDLPLQKYAAGEIGILEPTYARSYLIPAYRYLAGAPLSADEQKAAIALWTTRLTATDFSCAVDTAGWLKARTAVPGTPKLESIYTERAVSKEEPYQTYCNCQTSAFETATKTLAGLIQKFGAASPSVKDWLKAQDEVFQNCGSPPYSDKPVPTVIPAALPATVDAALVQDRAYQIAAANFYSQNFDQARKEFESIAGDTTSPWKNVAGYLAVRAMIRQATLSKELNKPLLTAADQKLQALAAEPAYADMSKDIAELRSFISARVTPEQHLEEIAKEKFTEGSLAELTKTIDGLVTAGGGDEQAVPDYSKLPASVKQPDMIDWVMTFQSADAAAKKHAVEKWKETHSVPWLVAAASAVDEKDPEAKAILAAATQAETGAGKWSLMYYANRLNLPSSKDASVRTALDKVVDHPPADLPIGSLNKFKAQRLTLSQNLDEFVRFGVQVPLSVCTNGGVEQVPDDVEEILKTGKGDKNTAEFIPSAAAVMDSKLPLAVLKQLATNIHIPNDLRNNVAWTSWVRAILIGDDTAGKELAQIAKPLNKAKTKLFDAYLAESTPDGRKFAASMLMLQFSSALPNVAWGPLRDDDYGDSSGWWWYAKPSVSTITLGYDNSKAVEPFNPEFLTPAQQAEAKKEVAKLDAVAAAPNYFANVVLPYAKAHPADPRVPQALHLLVKATHFGSTDDATKAYSKQAFTLLHTKYKTSSWTKQTPYYY